MLNSDWLKVSLKILTSSKVIVSSLLSLSVKKVIYDWDNLMCVFGNKPCTTQSIFNIFDIIFLLAMSIVITIIIYQANNDLHKQGEQK